MLGALEGSLLASLLTFSREFDILARNVGICGDSMNENKKSWYTIRRQIAQIIKVGAKDEYFSRAYDVVSMTAVVGRISSPRATLFWKRAIHSFSAPVH